MRRTVLIGAFLLVGGLASALLSAAAQPELQIGDGQVVATGLTPGGRVAWFAFARERTDWISQVFRWENLAADVDGAGRAVLDLGRSTPVKAIFVAVDVSTGAYAASSPSDYPWATEVPFPTGGLSFASDQASVIALRAPQDELEVLVVRPGVGAWRSTVRHDDAPLDATPGVDVNVSNLTPWGAAPSSPGSLRQGDVVVAIDPIHMQYFAQQLAGRR